MDTRLSIFAATALTALCGCRILETGYGDDNVVVRTSADAVSAAHGTVKSSLAWADDFSKLNLTPGRYRYETDTGFIEDTEGEGFGARLSRRASDSHLCYNMRYGDDTAC